MTAANLAVNDVSTVVQYTSTGETAFTFPWLIRDTSEIKVTVDAADQVEGTDYSVSGVDTETGGTVTFTAATTAGEIVTIWLDIPLKRLTGFSGGAATLLGEDLNDEFIRQVRIDKMLERDIGRALRLPIDDTVSGISMELPLAASRKGKILRFADGDGSPEMAEVSASSTVLSQSVIAGYLWPQTAAEVSAAVTPSDYAYPEGNVKRYGATGDGVTNDTTAIQTALSLNGVSIFFPHGTYVLTVSAAIDISGVPEICGENAVIDCSASTSTIIFDANGTRTSVLTAQSLALGDSTLDVTGLGLTFTKGQPILITSIEAHPNTNAATYFKGTRTYVDAVVGDELRLYPQIDFDYTTSAYIWQITENEFSVSGLRFIGNPAVNQACFVATLCSADIDADFDYFPSACVRFESSRGKFTGRIRYPYLINGQTNYGIAVSDLSEVAVNDAHIVGTRHAVTVGGGTWLQTDSGGSSGQAAYPGSVTISGGHYYSSRSGTAYATDPSLEIGAIDSHGIAKSLICTGAVIYGGCKIGPAESVLIANNTIYNHNYSCFEIVDSNNYAWGNVKLVDNDCYFIGDPDIAGTPTAGPIFINVGSAVFAKRLEANGNTYTVPQDLETGQTNSLGLIRGFDEIVLKQNSIYCNLAAADDEGRLEIWARGRLELRDNIFENLGVRFVPVRTATNSLAICNIIDNYSLGAPLSALLVVTNSLDSSATFREMTFERNYSRDAQNSGIQCRADMILRLYLINNRSINNNVAGSAADYQNSGIGIQTVTANDILELLVLKNNLAISDSDAADDHDQGIYIATGSSVNTDVICQDNISLGHTTADITGLAATGQTVVHEQGNTNQALETYTPSNVTPDRAFDADTVAVAELADVVGTLIEDLQDQGLLS